MGQIQTAEEFLAEQGLESGDLPTFVQQLVDIDNAKAAVARASLEKYAGRPDGEVLPLLEDGHAWGEVEARIPKDFFGQLLAKKSFGVEGLTSDEGIRDIVKAHPCCRVKTVSGRTTVGWREEGQSGKHLVKNYGYWRHQK